MVCIIKIDNLFIKFSDELILEKSNIIILNGQFTYLTGESGSGKTSVLKAIANMDISKISGYNFDNIDILKLHQDEKDQIRKKYISYVSQDEPMVKNYTLLENVQLILRSKGQHLDMDKLNELMTKLSLSKSKLSKKVSSLSNGERQRFSLICSLLGDYKLYLYDEPVSSLDETNKMVVMDLLKELVLSNKMVIIAQHKNSDNNEGVNYYIKNKRLHCNKLFGNNIKYDNQLLINDLNKKNNSFVIKEAINNITHMPYFNSICLIALSICIALTSMFVTHSYETFNLQAETLNDLYDKELFIINDSTSSSNFSIPYDEISILPIDNDIYEKIKSIEHIKSIKPNFYLTLEQFQYKEDGKIDILNMDDLGEIVLNQNGMTKKSISYKSLGVQKLLIGPTFEHQKFDDKCQILNVAQNGIYITSQLAKSLGIKDINNCSLTINVSVPIASEIGVKEIDNQKYEVIRGPITVLKKITLPIRGILKNISTNSYLSGDSPMMFLPIETIEGIMQQTREENMELIENLASIKITDNIINQFSDNLLLSNNWAPSAYVLEIDNYQNLTKVKTEIMKISNNLLIRDSYFNGTTTSTLVNQQKLLSIGLSLLLILFSIILIIFIDYFKMRKKIKYFNYLQRLGWSKIEIIDLLKKESLIYTLLLLPLSIILLVFINKYLFLQIKVNFLSIVVELSVLGLLLCVQILGLNTKINKIMEV